MWSVTYKFKVFIELRSGGFLLVQGSLGERVYTVGSAAFPTLDVTQADVEETFRNCRLTTLDWFRFHQP